MRKSLLYDLNLKLIKLHRLMVNMERGKVNFTYLEGKKKALKTSVWEAFHCSDLYNTMYGMCRGKWEDT